jgi:hypothetical protein
MNFSIVLASRQRIPLLENMLKSIKETCCDLNQIEVLIGIDNDDSETRAASQRLKNDFHFAKFFSRTRSTMLNRDYINWVYENNGSGKYIIVCNDDCVFKTIDWDNKIISKISKYLQDKPDGIVYGYISDSIVYRFGLNYCCFPLVTRKAFECTKMLMPPQCPAWGADIYLWQIYNSIDRVCDMSEIMIEHFSFHSEKRERDQISHHVENISRKPFKVPAENYSKQLAEFIASFRN